MGRGRAKAKQTKVARELKYSSPTTDLERLQRELSGGGGPLGPTNGKQTDDKHAAEVDDEFDDPYAEYAAGDDEEFDEDEDDDWGARG